MRVFKFSVIFSVLYTGCQCARYETLEETDLIHVRDHPVIKNYEDDSSTSIFTPTIILKPTGPSVVVNCQCGEHEHKETKIEEKNCGERPFRSSDDVPSSTLERPEKAISELPVQYVSNGTFTGKSQFPWVVALVERRNNGSAIHFCGGTLISSKLVLTATHCFTKRFVNRTEVWLNERKLFLSTDNEHPTLKIKANRLIVHPNYDFINNYNDILLIELSEPVDIEKTTLRPICLPNNASYDNEEFAYTAGWGRISYSGPKSNELQHVCLPLLTHEQCTTGTVPYYKHSVTEWMICAGDVKNGGRDACPGDSGGPLFVEAGPRKLHYLVGIVSWGESCSLPKKPGVYTRVSKYLPWIEKEARASSGNLFCGLVQ